MKKLLLLLTFLISFSCFGQVFGDWQTGEIVDDWGDSTGQRFIITNKGGTFFRVMKDKAGELTISIYTSDFLDSETEARTSYIRVDSNTPHKFTGYTWGASANNMIDIYTFTDGLISEMKAGAKLRTINYDYNDVKILDAFSLNGFTRAYNWLMK